MSTLAKGLLALLGALVFIFSVSAFAKGLPSALVASVSGAPKSLEEVSANEHSRAFRRAWKLMGYRQPPKPASPAWQESNQRAMDELLDGIWIMSEGQEMNIRISKTEFRRAYWNARKSQGIVSKKKYNRYLRQSGYSNKEVLFATRVSITAQKIENRVKQDGDWGVWYEAYKAKWTARTTCASAYLVPRCGNFAG